MKIQNIIGALFTIGLMTCFTASASDKAEGKLAAQAKISKAEEVKTALAKVPGGTIKEGELEKEHGKLVWSFDIATPGSKDITEIQVDAKTGNIVSETKETPEDQAKEKKEDEHEKKGKKEKDDDEKDEKN